MPTLSSSKGNVALLLSFKPDWSFTFSVKAFWPLQPTRPSDPVKERRERMETPSRRWRASLFLPSSPQLRPSSSRLSGLSPATPRGVSSAHHGALQLGPATPCNSPLTPIQATADCFTHSLTNIYWVPTMCSINAGVTDITRIGKYPYLLT